MTLRSHLRTALLGIGLCVVLVVGLVGSSALRPAASGDPAAPSSAPGSFALASVDPSPSPLRSDQVVHRPTEVFGFLPYWSMADWTDSYLRYDLLTTIAFFGIGVRTNGTLITSGPGFDAFMSPRAQTIIDHAHAAGVRVVITFESFGAAKNKKFLAKPGQRATFVAEASAFVAAHGLDGLNLDVEGLDGADRPNFGLLVGDLAGSIHAANPTAEVSVATNANVSGARMAKIALDVGADRAFLMGYAYRVATTAAVGGIAPYTGVGTALDLVRSLDLYEVNGVAPEEIILGLPYYGMTWPTTTNELHAPRQPASAGLGSGRAYRPRTAVGVAAPPDQILDYDVIEQVARLTWYDATRKTWFQTYYDDPATLLPKEHLAVERGLAGVGIWALGDDAGQPGYWETIAATLGLGPPYVAPSPTPTPSPSPSPSLSPSPSGSPGGSPSASVGPSTSPSTRSSPTPTPFHLVP